MPNAHLRVAHVYEQPNGWTLDGRHYTSAVAVLRSVRRKDRRTCRQGGFAATLINWHPSTKIGAAAVRALGHVVEGDEDNST